MEQKLPLATQILGSAFPEQDWSCHCPKAGMGYSHGKGTGSLGTEVSPTHMHLDPKIPKIAQFPNLSAPIAAIGYKRAPGCHQRASGKGKEKEERKNYKGNRGQEKREGAWQMCGCGSSLWDPNLFPFRTSWANMASPSSSLQVPLTCS